MLFSSLKTTTTWNLTHVGQLLLSKGLHWGMVDIPGASPLKKIHVPSPSSYQSQIVSWLGVESVSTSWNFVQLELIQVLYMLSCYPWVYMCVVPGRHCFWEVIHQLWLFHSFCLLFYIDLWALRGWGVDENVLFMSKSVKLSDYLHIVLWIAILITILLQKEASLMRTEWCADLWV